MDSVSLVVVTGMSGAGKSTASKALEDLGYYTIDNMPLSVIERFVKNYYDGDVRNSSRLALVIDIRSGDSKEAYKIIGKLQVDYKAQVIFLTADENVLIRRYKESRRKHPLAKDISESVKTEAELLKEIKSISDIVIDTSAMNVHQLTGELNGFFNENVSDILVTVNSFGFKHGAPVDSDLLFDVRFLKNPYFVEEMRDRTGLEQDVQDYVMSDAIYETFLEKLKDMLDFLIPQYRREGKRFLVISFGCTGGRHRSVTVAENIARHIAGMEGVTVQTRHRDIDK